MRCQNSHMVLTGGIWVSYLNYKLKAIKTMMIVMMKYIYNTQILREEPLITQEKVFILIWN